MSRDRTRHNPRTYAEACEELGGEPWQAFNGTEQWFLIDEKEDEPSRPTTIDTGQFRIPKPSLGEWLQKRLIWLTLGGFALTGIVVAAAMPRASLAAPPPPIVITVPPPPPIQLAPPPMAPALAPPVAVAAPAAAPAPTTVHKKFPVKKPLRGRRRRR